jgi:hypothetical protein
MLTQPQTGHKFQALSNRKHMVPVQPEAETGVKAGRGLYRPLWRARPLQDLTQPPAEFQQINHCVCRPQCKRLIYADVVAGH